MLPLILGIIAAVAGGTGAGAGIHGGVKMHRANKKMQNAKERDYANMKRMDAIDSATVEEMDKLGNYELSILRSFKEFAEQLERIQNRPSFADVKIDDFQLPKFSFEDVKQASVGAGVLIGSLGGGVLGVAGGFAAAGGTTAAVTALGTASTGVAISSLSGAAATNATLAALGGGSIAAGGGGMALGTTILSATTAGVGLLIGGVIFSLVGSSIEGKADKAVEQMLKNEEKVLKICNYLSDLKESASKYKYTLSRVNRRYLYRMRKMTTYFDSKWGLGSKVNWNELPDDIQLVVKNTVLLVGLLYNMCKVNIVNQPEKEGEPNTVNHQGIDEYIQKAEDVIETI